MNDTKLAVQLSGVDIGRLVKVIDEDDFVHTGTLASLSFSTQYGTTEVRVMLTVVSASRARWIGHVGADALIEVKK